MFSHWVMSNSLWSHGLLYTRLPCPSLSPGVCSNSCPLSWWCYLTNLILCLPLLLLSSVLMRVFFSNELALWIRWPKYWSSSFSISPSNEYSGLISFRIDWFDLLAVWVSIVYTHQSLNSSPSFPYWHPYICSLIIFWSCLVKVWKWKWKSFSCGWLFVIPWTI